MNTTIKIKNILGVDEVRSSVSMKLKITVQWKDMGFKYLDLKNITAMNTSTASDIDRIWTPNLVFTNTRNSQRVSFKNESTHAEIEIIEGMMIF